MCGKYMRSGCLGLWWLLISVGLLVGCGSINNDETVVYEDIHIIETEIQMGNETRDINETVNGANSGDNKITVTEDISAGGIVSVDETVTETMMEGVNSQEEPDVNDYVRVLDYIPDIIVDLKYATADNFTGQVIYDFTDAYLRYGTVVKLKAAQEQLKEQGYLIKIWDAYRPFYAQERLWEVYPDGRYVANPAKGMTAHNLGNTIDITIVNPDGSEVVMPTGFDDFSTRADRDYSEIDEEAAAHAMLLQDVMYQNGFTGYFGEWWDYSDTVTYTEIEDFMP